MSADVARAWLPPSGRRLLLGLYLLLGGSLSLLIVALYIALDTIGWDSRWYWAVTLDTPYQEVYGEHGIFIYSPAAKIVSSAFGVLPWPVFLAAWTVVSLAVVRWLAGTWQMFFLLLAFFPVVDEICVGNIHLFLAAAVVLGFRWPAAWAFVLLTKVTPGIGLLWFAVRREWRNLGIALGATAAIAGVSFLILPGQWADWLTLLTTNSGAVNVPVWPRLIIAAGLVTWGALTDRRWTVLIAAMLAVPAVWLGAFSMVAALPAIWRQEQAARRPSQQAMAPSPSPAG